MKALTIPHDVIRQLNPDIKELVMLRNTNFLANKVVTWNVRTTAALYSNNGMFINNLRTVRTLKSDALFAKHAPDEVCSFEDRFSRADLEYRKLQMKIFNEYKTKQATFLHQKYRLILF